MKNSSKVILSFIKENQIFSATITLLFITLFSSSDEFMQLFLPNYYSENNFFINSADPVLVTLTAIVFLISFSLPIPLGEPLVVSKVPAFSFGLSILGNTLLFLILSIILWRINKKSTITSLYIKRLTIFIITTLIILALSGIIITS